MDRVPKGKSLPVAGSRRFVWRAGNTAGRGSMASLARALRVGECDDALTTGAKPTACGPDCHEPSSRRLPGTGSALRVDRGAVPQRSGVHRTDARVDAGERVPE